MSILVGIVTFQPDVCHLERTFHQLHGFAESLVVVDNGSSDALVKALRELQSSYPHVQFVFDTNRGVGAAHNQIVRLAIISDIEQVLLLDQDTTIDAQSLMSMKSRLESIILRDPSAVAIGPLLSYDGTESALIRPVDSLESRDRLVVFLPASGMLAQVSAFSAHGLFREDYFIDHVDREWGERLFRAGARLYCATDIVVHHELGDALPNGSRPRWNYHANPQRDYYLIRNHFLTCRDIGYGVGPMMRQFVFISHWALLTLVKSPKRLQRAYWMVRGLIDGIANRSGAVGAVRSRVRSGTLSPPRAEAHS